MADDFLTLQEVVQAARRNLDQGPWDYLTGGSESETTMRRNRLELDRLALRARVCVDVSSVDTSTTFLGHQLRIPVLLAPIGSLQTIDPDGGVASARAAGEFGTLPVISSVTEPALEDIMRATSNPKIFQLYVFGDWDWCKDITDRVVKAGYAAFAVTVDNAVYSRRERPLLSRWVTPTRRTPQDPKWRAGVTWDLIDRLRDEAKLPFILKGVQSPEDAAIAVQHGIEVVWVSNHGGRQLDFGQGTMELLPEIVQAVAGRAVIVVDGGIQRGTDVIKALALGANAVAIGKLQGWGLAAGGAAGLVRVLELLEDEIRIAMGLMGVTSVSQLNLSHVTASHPVMWPHEMSAYSNLVEGPLR
jgi:isopentenyl diphosphate isomerase/L-lactate dehydrogenase-like FMN-dependent dehydrogenase